MTGTQRADDLSQKGRKDSQRQRLLEAMTEICAREGYGPASIAEVIALAQVSRATFYDYFEDKDSCFRAALEASREQLLTDVGKGVDHRRESTATRCAIQALLQFASRTPAGAQILIYESLAGGPHTARLYDELLDCIARIIDSAEARSGGEQAEYLVPLRILLGAICQVIWSPLHNGETAAELLLSDLAGWVEEYRIQHPLPATPQQSHADSQSYEFLPNPSLRAPNPLAPGRKSLPAGEVNRNRRERILFATAKVAASRGYLTMTVDDLVAEAQIAKRIFYKHFKDKDEALLGAVEFFSQPLLATAAKAFFSSEAWPEKVRRTSRALLCFLSIYPEIAHILLIDRYAAPEQVKRSITATGRALELLLEQGYQLPDGKRPPRRTSELVIAAARELANRLLRQTEHTPLPEQLPSFTAIVLTPFIGAEQTVEMITAPPQSDQA